MSKIKLSSILNSIKSPSIDDMPNNNNNGSKNEVNIDQSINNFTTRPPTNIKLDLISYHDRYFNMDTNRTE